MKCNALIVGVLLIGSGVAAQPSNRLVQKGNVAYKKGQYQAAGSAYQQALEVDSSNSSARFNLGNTLLKSNNPEAAAQQYDQLLASAGTDAALQAKAWYNKGLSLVKQQKMQDAVQSFKQSLRLAPDDNDTRENLQKALNEIRQQQQQPPPRASNKKQDQQKQQQPPPQKQQAMNRQMMEQRFNELRNKEKELQKQLQQKNNTQAQPEKDW